jgi:hypothetical protein
VTARASPTASSELEVNELFQIEGAATLAGDTAEQRLTRRIQHSTPIMDALRVWLDEQRAVVPPKTALGRALRYLHRQWRRLTLFLQDGNLELTNNRRERELRRLVLGKKNPAKRPRMTTGRGPLSRSASMRFGS